MAQTSPRQDQTQAHWQRYMIEAERALSQGALGSAVCLYQQALGTISAPLEAPSQAAVIDGEGLVPQATVIDLEELATMRVATCHRLADFWRAMEEPSYELRYLKLAAELVTALVPQCPNRECESLISELGCCRAALLAFLKRHPNPEIARLIQVQDKVQGCELIGRFRLN
ncbi:DUF2753 family protein [Aeromonas bivalvium]|uniref:DUF2753 family protein n=1 Tax=Aeromonas bivalvium TaxID=440079 RepID=UPI003D1DF5CE